MDLWYILGYGKEALSAFDTLAKALGYQKADGKKEDMKELVKALRILLKPTFSLRIGGLSGIVAVSMAAYGAHEILIGEYYGRQSLSVVLILYIYGAINISIKGIFQLKIYEKGYKMQLLHSVALAHSENCRFPYVTCGLFTLGILLYSGSCYAHALSGNASYRYFTYAGEASLAAAWFSMLIS